MSDIKISKNISTNPLGAESNWCAEFSLQLDLECSRLTVAARELPNDMRTDRTFDEHHGIVRKYRKLLESGAGVVADTAAIEEIVKQAIPLLQRVMAGSQIEYDGRNMRGVLTDDATIADDELALLVDSTTWFQEDPQVCSAKDWIAEADVAYIARLSPEDVVVEAAKDNVILVEWNDITEIQRAIDERLSQG